MIAHPKRPRPKEEAPPTADDVSITGSRVITTGRTASATREGDARLETFEQDPRQGEDNARLPPDADDPSSEE